MVLVDRPPGVLLAADPPGRVRRPVWWAPARWGGGRAGVLPDGRGLGLGAGPVRVAGEDPEAAGQYGRRLPDREPLCVLRLADERANLHPAHGHAAVRSDPPDRRHGGRLCGGAAVAGLRTAVPRTKMLLKWGHPGGPGYLAALDTAAARRS